MATYNGDDIVASNQMVFKTGDIAEFTRTFKFTLSNTTLTTGDKIQLIPIPGETGCVLTDYFIEMPVLDTGTTMSWNLGDTTNTTASSAYVSGCTGGRTATGPCVVTPEIIYFQTATTSAGTALAGNVRGVLPVNYKGLTSGNTTTGGTQDVFLLLTMVTGPGTAVSTGINIRGWIKLQNNLAPQV